VEADEGIEKDDQSQNNQDQDRRPKKPRRAVSNGGDVEVVLGDLAQDEPENQRRPGPAAADHHVTEKTKDEQNQQVSQMIIGSIGANKGKKEDERNQNGAAHQGELGQLIKED